MAENKHQDLFCSQCFLQFDKKYVFDLHFSLVHGKNLGIKNEASELSFDKSRENEEILKNSEKSKSFKCKTCKKSFKLKDKFTKHVSSAHGEKKSFKCKICDYRYSLKSNLKIHVAS